jgi:hypothetical protein
MGDRVYNRTFSPNENENLFAIRNDPGLGEEDGGGGSMVRGEGEISPP